MITFRYHIVSLVAVFLALAVGIVVGTTALNGPVTSDLRRQVNDLKKERTALAAQTKKLQGQVDDASAFAQAFGPSITSGTLDNQRILIVGLPGVSIGAEDAINSQLTSAGAQVTGRLNFTASFIDPAQGASIATLATGTHPFGLTLPVTSDPGLLGAATLAFVLTGSGQATDLKSVLTGFAGLHMISSDPQSIESAKTILVIGSGSLPSTGSAGQSELDLVSALAGRGAKVVVAGDAGSGTGGIVSLVRGSGSKATVSTVDNADSSVGQITTTLAVAGAVNGQVGQYGTQKGADAVFPTPTK